MNAVVSTLVHYNLNASSVKFIIIHIILQDAAADALSKFYYPPVAAVTVSYPKEAIRAECLIDGQLKGFGQLHPRSQGVETLGSLFYLIEASYIYMFQNIKNLIEMY